MFAALLQRDMRLAFRRAGQYVNPLVFFAVVTSLFPLALAPEPELLRAVGTGVVWVAAMLASLLLLERLFQADLDDGVIDQMLLADSPLVLGVYARLLAHWLTTGLPLLLVAPAIAMSFYLPWSVMPTLLAGLFFATLGISVLGGIGAALTLSARTGGGLIGLLVLPLMSPLLVFGAMATDFSLHDEPTLGPVLLLAAFAVLAWSLGPWVIAAALRVASEA